DPVAPGHPQCRQPGPDPGHLGGELGVGQRDLLALLAAADHRDPGRVRVRRAQRVARVVEGGAGEPGHVRHRAAGQHRPVAALAQHSEVVPERAPERGQLIDRPPPEPVIVARRRVRGLRPARARPGPPRGAPPPRRPPPPPPPPPGPRPPAPASPPRRTAPTARPRSRSRAGPRPPWPRRPAYAPASSLLRAAATRDLSRIFATRIRTKRT